MVKKLFNLHEITGNSATRAHLVRQLEGGTTLTSRIRASTDFARGRLLIALPEGVELTQLSDFESGGWFRYVSGAGQETLARVLKWFLADREHGVLLQDTQAHVTDGWLQGYEYRHHIVTYNEEIYWRLTDSGTSEDEVLGVIASASVYPSSAFLYVSDLERRTELDDHDLQKVIDTLAGIAVGAFDEDSFLLWWAYQALPPLKFE